MLCRTDHCLRIFLSKCLSFLSSNHNVLMFFTSTQQILRFFFKVQKCSHHLYQDFSVSLSCLVLLGSSVCHDTMSITTCRAFYTIDNVLWFQIIISQFRLIRTHHFYIKTSPTLNNTFSTYSMPVVFH